MARKKKVVKPRLDKLQSEVYTHFTSKSYLSDARHVENLIEWVTFYRRNMHRFAMHYLGLKIYLYQAFLLWLMSKSTEAVIVASRAAAKSFVIAIFACCKAILYPNSQIVIASGTKGQANLIVKEKIQKELMPASPNLRMEIRDIKTNNQDTQVVFHNGSTITVVVANDNARGHRSTVMIYEEFRMISKHIIDSVLSQFQHVRDTGFKDMPEYKDLPPEESASVFISSAWYRSHWMWKTIVDAAKASVAGGTACMVALDYCISLYHRIKTRKQLIELKRRSDPMTWQIECENIMVGENAQSFFGYEMLAKNQNIPRAMYPKTVLERAMSKKGAAGCLPHQDGEIRILSCDMAFVDKKNNDNSIMSVIRMLPEAVGRDTSQYRKQVVYMESIHGGDTTAQALRIKQLFYEMNCDYCVLDVRNAGIAVYDMLARVMWDEEMQIEYRPWKAMNDDAIAERIRTEGAEAVVYTVAASARLNSEIAMLTRREFSEGRVDLLIPHAKALDDVLPKIKEYKECIDLDEQLFYEKPYLETQAFINEAIELVYERMADTGMIKISEQGTKTKDRYTSVSYGLYFASEVERENTRSGSEYETMALCN